MNTNLIQCHRTSRFGVRRWRFDIVSTLLLLLGPAAGRVWADVRYVDATGANPMPPCTKI